jgi:hypothetical protein
MMLGRVRRRGNPYFQRLWQLYAAYVVLFVIYISLIGMCIVALPS